MYTKPNFWCITVSIRCYQCSSDEDKSKGEDHCGVYSKFDKDYHVPVDCQGDESYTPGTFCVKLTQQSPRGFIWDGRLVTRQNNYNNYYFTGNY